MRARLMEPIDALRMAGRIASQIRRRVVDRIDVGSKIIDICDLVEGWAREQGGVPGFPCNVDIDHVAAHYTSPLGDATVVAEGSLVKVDIGVSVEGYLADTAVTVCFDPRLERLVEAAEAALDAGIGVIRAGTRSSDVGAVIERAMRQRGVAPITNLTGHKMTRFVVHAGSVIPNVSSINGHALEEGEVYAVEPFTILPDGAGEVTNGPPGHIYQFQKKRSVDGEVEREMLRFIQSEYRTLPFASRWVLRRFPGKEGSEAFTKLLRSKCLHPYPQLVERSHRQVAQAEHTVIVTEDGCEVTTA